MNDNEQNLAEGQPENLESIDINYDGSNVISSVPFDKYEELEKIDDFNLERTNEKQEEKIEEEKETVGKESELKTHIEKLMKHNVDLLKKVSEYQKAFLDVMTKKSAPEKQEQGENIEQLDEKLNSIYIKAKEDSVKESVALIEDKINYDKRIQKYADENPDIANDEFNTFIVSTLAARYIDSGKKFDDSIIKAIADFRKLTGANKLPMREKEVKAMAAHIEGSSQPKEEPVYTSQELVEMQLYRPEEYIRLQPKIIKAYKEGRVL